MRGLLQGRRKIYSRAMQFKFANFHHVIMLKHMLKNMLYYTAHATSADRFSFRRIM